MEISLRKMKVFMAIVEAGSFTKGAAAVKISQPAAAAIVDEIEGISKHQLFLRSGKVRTAKLTREGEEVFKVFSRVVSSYELEIGKITSLHRSLRKSSLIQDAYSSSIDLSRLTGIMRRYQESNIEIGTRSRREVIDSVAKREAILGVIDDAPDNSNVDFKQIGVVSISLAVPSGLNILSDSQRALPWRNVPDSAAIFSGVSPKLLSQIQANLSVAGLDTGNMITINNKEFARSFLSDLRRPVVIPSTMTEEIEALGLGRVLTFSHSPVSAPLGIIAPKGYINAMKISNRELQSILRSGQPGGQEDDLVQRVG